MPLNEQDYLNWLSGVQASLPPEPSEAARMRRIESEMRAPAVQLDTSAQNKRGQYSGMVRAQNGPLSAMGTVTPDAAMGRVAAGPVSYQQVYTGGGQKPIQSVQVGGMPFDADTYFGVGAQRSPGGDSYNANISRGGFNAGASYNPTQRALNVQGQYETKFAGGGPVHMEGGGFEEAPPLTIYRKSPPKAPEGERDELAGVPAPEAYSRRFASTLRSIPQSVIDYFNEKAAQPDPSQRIAEDVAPFARGLANIPSAIGNYFSNKADQPDPSQRVAEDVQNLGRGLGHMIAENPIGTAIDFTGLGGAVTSIPEIKKLNAELEQAEAEGDVPKARSLKTQLAMAASAMLPVAGGIAKAGAKGSRLAEEAAKAAKAEGAIEDASKIERVATEGAEPAIQAISSADTSIKQVPALFKSKAFDVPTGSRNLDIGGGKYDLGTDYLRENKGVENLVHDPFNRTPEHNEAVMRSVLENPTDTVTAANVLNVIAEPEARNNVVQQAFDSLKPGGTAYFDIYEGSRSGEGAKTSKGWQNNMKADAYLEEIQQVFPDAQRKGTMIIASKPDMPVMQVFNEIPDAPSMRSDMIGEIDRSIASSGGAQAKLSTTLGLGPMYVVDSGITNLPEQNKFLLASTKNANAERQLDGITKTLDKYPNMGLDPRQWTKAFAEATGSQSVVAPPYRFMKAIKNGEYEDLLRSLTEGQIRDADAGFANGKKFLSAYTSGQMNVADTGKLFMWGILSRGVDPFTHEGMFLDAFNGIDPWVEMAAKGKFTKEVAEGDYKKWASTTAPEGSGQAGSGAMHNLNAFGEDFLVKMGRPGADGITPMQKLHDLMSDPSLSGRDIRREFAKVGEGVGIDNKVVSFILLATGRDDVMVIDRIQLKNLWDDGRYGDINIWDGVSVPAVKLKDGSIKRFSPSDEGRLAARELKQSSPGSKAQKSVVTGSSLAEATYGAKGILVYEAIEDALMKTVGDLYTKLGRPEAASPGRFHWETWVARSNQEASHGSLGSILAKRQGSSEPLAGVYSKQGDYQTYAYGAKYGVGKDGPFYAYPLSTGEEVTLSPSGLKDVLENVKNPKYGVIPKGFKVSETTGRPWYEREGVNRAKLDDLIRSAAGAGGQAGPLRRASGGSVSNGSGHSRGAGTAAAVREISDKADNANLKVPQLAHMIRVASGMNMPPERAREFAQQILMHDLYGLTERFNQYSNARRTLMRVNAMIGGTAHKNTFKKGGLFQKHKSLDVAKHAANDLLASGMGHPVMRESLQNMLRMIK